jgi:sugar lactone lactonase YvrE
MRFVSHKVSIKLPAFLFVLLLFAGLFSPASGQTAPYILPYTMSTFAGPISAATAGSSTGCGNYVVLGATVSSGNYVALDAVGDGCQVPGVPNSSNGVSVGSDPHDIRVDATGNIYWADNTSKDVVHKIFGSTGLETIYAGSVTTSSICAAGNSKDGYNCTATDGAANSGTTHYSGNFGTIRGIGVGVNGDVFIADYSNHLADRIPAPSIVTEGAATGIMALVAGTSASGGYADGPVGTSKVDAPRGIGVDPNTGTIYIADTGNDIVRKSVYTPGTGYTVSSVTAPAGAVVSGSAGCTTAPYSKSVGNPAAPGLGVPVASALICAPEDAQVDLNGNVYVVDNSNAVVREIYNGKGTVPGVTNPTAGYVYLVAGYSALNTAVTQFTYPTDGTSPAAPATTIAMNIRKISLDSLGNIYIPDDGATSNNVWFVDHATGYARSIAGMYGAATPATTAGFSPNCGAPFVRVDSVGDGCPGTEAGLFTSTGSNPGAAADNQGNLYLTDSEGTKSPTTARIRKLLSGLNFPPTVLNTAATQQTLLFHFAVGDTEAVTNPFVSSGTDFVVGTPSCTVNTQTSTSGDNTSDCLVPVVFTPTKAGYDTATLTITSALGGINSYLLTGTGTAPLFAIDPGTTSLVSTPSATSNAQGVAFDGVGNAYIADTGNNRVLFYSAATSATTVFAGTGASGYSGDTHLATAATLNGPKAVTIGTDGAVYIADTGNNVIRKVNAAGIITTFAGGGSGCSAINPNPNDINSTYVAIGDGCPAVNATLSSPSGIVADNLGNIYVSDTGNNLIREINNLGWISTLAGGDPTSSCAIAAPSTCSGLNTSFNHPTGLAFDKTGSFILVADTGDYLVRKIALSNTFAVSSAGVASNIYINGVTAVAGNTTSGTTLGSTATGSQLTSPTGVAVDAAENVYIADAGNAAVYLVNVSSANGAPGTLSTIIGINGSAGTGTLGSATTVQLNAPASVAISSNGTLLVADSGNNRILSDQRSQVTFNMGRINPGSSSPTQIFTEVNIGNTTTALSTPFYTAAGSGGTQFTLTSPSSGGCVNGESLAPSEACTLQAQFNPASIGNFSETYTEGATSPASAGGSPSLTLTGAGAVLTPTLSTVAQTIPATGNSQYGGSVTFSVSVAPTAVAGCNTAAPSCYPTGTVRIIIGTSATNGTAGSPLTLSSTGTASQVVTGLAVGTYFLSCSYSGDDFYAASSCANVSVAVAPASTTSTLAISNNNQPQFTAASFSATVISNTSGIPTGTVTFYASGTAIGTPTTLSGAGVATLALSASYDTSGNLLSNNTLAPGTYQITCIYNGNSNFATSNCAPMSYTVAPSPVGFNPLSYPLANTNQTFVIGPVVALPCPAVDLYIAGTSTPAYGVLCSSGSSYVPSPGSTPNVTTADGSTTDATIFFSPTNTMTGKLTFACSGLPATTTCTFSPSSITLTASTQYVNPLAVDVTFWTDLQPTAALHGLSNRHDQAAGIYAAMIGWPMALLGLGALLFIRRRSGVRKGLSLLAMLLIMAGSSLALSGCAGPGSYKASLTPAGTYPITITVTNTPGGASASAVVNFTVAAPGITGQE